ncbi:hypothetical protein HYC85_017776 [Camellia sinensis]|uniref:Pentacotripeptide-repeat region of PRORP domain-containing protein n=1 Tax=Camellia sinensis TaxID=4442 RepID=A0A7J7GSD2_CAMSI|nr:hypothetical protein HYC85_017776 [Camellia sinensis]
MKFEPPSHSSLVVCMYYCCNLQVWNNERNKTFEVADDSSNLIFSLMSKTLLSRIKPRHNPKPSSSPSFSFKPHIKRLVNELCDILKTHHHNQWQDTLETRLSEEEIVPSDIAHLVLDRIRDPELDLKFFDWVTQRPYDCSLHGFAYSSLFKLLASSRVFSEIETVLESMKVEDKLPTREALDTVIQAYSDSGLVDKALEIYTTVLSTSNSVPSVLACNSLLNALVKEGRIEIASRRTVDGIAHGVISLTRRISDINGMAPEFPTLSNTTGLVDSVVYLVDAYDKERFAEAKKELDALHKKEQQYSTLIGFCELFLVFGINVAAAELCVETWI